MGVRRSGFALILVLVAVASLFALAMHGAIVARSNALEVGALHERIRAERYARGAVVVAVSGLVPRGEASLGGGLGGEGSSVADGEGAPAPPPAPDEDDRVEIPDFLKELIPELAEVEDAAKKSTGVDQEVVRRVSDGGGMTGRAPRDTVLRNLSRVGIPVDPVRVEIEGRAFRVRMWDAMGLLNINTAEAGQLERYFVAKGVDSVRAEALAAQIIDWRDEDSVTGTQGAEQSAYARLGVTCRNAAFGSLEELLFLPAMDRALYERVEGDLALGGDGKIHVGTAPRAVLESVPGISKGIVDEILEMRSRPLGLTSEAFEDLLPSTRRRELLEVLRVDLSGVLRVNVEALSGPSDRVTSRFDGIAFVGNAGVREVGLRPM